ncbi:MAG: hypothetical protein ACP5IM_00080 [Candidatus Bathyarchaeia archaeon]
MALEDLKAGVSVAGVDNRLMLIEPTEKGRWESGIVGREEYVVKILKISVDTVLDRVHALLRRDGIGRTGSFSFFIAPSLSFTVKISAFAAYFRIKSVFHLPSSYSMLLSSLLYITVTVIIMRLLLFFS